MKEESEAINYWMEVLATRRESTRISYVQGFKHFSHYLNKTPDEMLAERKGDLESQDQKVRHRYEVLLKKYIAYLDSKGYSTGTQKRRYAIVRSFFDSHYLALELRRTDAPSGESIGSRIPEKAEIRKMIDLAPDLKWRVLICFLKDIGWRIGDVVNLIWGDINEIESDFWYFLKLTQKRKVKAVGFIGPETVGLLRLYRSQRVERGESLTSESPLFLSRRGGFLGVVAVSKQIGKLAKLGGIANVTAHSFRKYFRANLEPHVPNTWLKRMLGKKISASTEPYSETRPKMLLAAYKKAYNALRLQELPKGETELRKRELIHKIETLSAIDPRYEPLLEKVKKYLAGVPVGGAPLAQRIERAEEMLESEIQRLRGEEDCQRIVTEAELERFLAQGWRVTATLPSGKIIIDNNHH